MGSVVKTSLFCDLKPGEMFLCQDAELYMKVKIVDGNFYSAVRMTDGYMIKLPKYFPVVRADVSLKLEAIDTEKSESEKLVDEVVEKLKREGKI